MHFPEEWTSLERARERIVFDEFLIFELMLLIKIRLLRAKKNSIPIQAAADFIREFRSALPFELTKDQMRAIDEIKRNISAPSPMNRLLQGEVGSGKTVVAACVLCLAVRSGLQAALVAPERIPWRSRAH